MPVIDSFQMPSRAVKPLMLVIDDCVDMRSVIKFEFKDSYRVIEANNGVQGFEKAVAQVPDVIVSDVVMPGLDGISLCKKLKEYEFTNHIPILLITIEDAEEHILSGLQNGADDYITKPFRVSILKAKVNSLLESRHLLLKHYMQEAIVQSDKQASGQPVNTFLVKANEVVEANLLTAGFEAKDFALAVGVSRAQLYRKIKIFTGCSVKEYVRNIRLKKAADMLINTDKNVSEVAYDVGFSSVAYFSSSFNSYFKVTPREFISMNK